MSESKPPLIQRRCPRRLHLEKPRPLKRAGITSEGMKVTSDACIQGQEPEKRGNNSSLDLDQRKQEEKENNSARPGLCARRFRTIRRGHLEKPPPLRTARLTMTDVGSSAESLKSSSELSSGQNKQTSQTPQLLQLSAGEDGTSMRQTSLAQQQSAIKAEMLIKEALRKQISEKSASKQKTPSVDSQISEDSGYNDGELSRQGSLLLSVSEEDTSMEEGLPFKRAKNSSDDLDWNDLDEEPFFFTKGNLKCTSYAVNQAVPFSSLSNSDAMLAKRKLPTLKNYNMTRATASVGVGVRTTGTEMQTTRVNEEVWDNLLEQSAEQTTTTTVSSAASPVIYTGYIRPAKPLKINTKQYDVNNCNAPSVDVPRRNDYSRLLSTPKKVLIEVDTSDKDKDSIVGSSTPKTLTDSEIYMSGESTPINQVSSWTSSRSRQAETYVVGKHKMVTSANKNGSNLNYRDVRDSDSSSSMTCSSQNNDDNDMFTSDEEQEYIWEVIEDLTEKVHNLSIEVESEDKDMNTNCAAASLKDDCRRKNTDKTADVKKILYKLPSLGRVEDPLYVINDELDMEDTCYRAESFIREGKLEKSSKKPSQSRLIILREPISPITMLKDIWEIEKDLPSGMYWPRGRRSIFRCYAACKLEMPANKDAKKITYSVQELLMIGRHPVCRRQPESWAYKVKMLSDICLPEVKSFLDTEDFCVKYQYILERSWMKQERGFQIRRLPAEQDREPVPTARTANWPTQRPQPAETRTFRNSVEDCEPTHWFLSQSRLPTVEENRNPKNARQVMNIQGKCDVRVRNNNIMLTQNSQQSWRRGFGRPKPNTSLEPGFRFARPPDVGPPSFQFSSRSGNSDVFRFKANVEKQSGVYRPKRYQPAWRRRDDGPLQANPFLPVKCPW